MKIRKLIIVGLMIVCTFSLKTKAEEIDLPEEVQEICIEVGEEFDICPAMLMAIVWQESRGILDNLTQITYAGWFQEGIAYTGLDDIKDQRNNIRICAYYMRKWADEYNDINVSLTGWSQGIENSVAINGQSSYAKTVINKSREFEKIWNYGRSK